MNPPWSSSLVQVEVMRPGEGTVYGTGFAIGARSVLTAGHNLVDPRFPQLPQLDNIRVLALPTMMGETIGIPISAHLSLGWKGPSWPPLEDYCILKLSKDLNLPPLVPAPLPLAGFPQNFAVVIGGYAKGALSFSWKTGEASLEPTGLLRYQVATIEGHSGAPVMVEYSGDWHVVGLHQALMEKGRGLAFASSIVASFPGLPPVLV